MFSAAELPDDVESLQRLLIEQRRAALATQAELISVRAEADTSRAALIASQLEIERLRFQIACLKRARFGRSSEQLDTQIAQLALTLEDLEASQAALPPRASPLATPPVERPVRRPLPAHLPRETVTHGLTCTCPDCGAELKSAGEDVAEMIEWVPAHLKVIRHGTSSMHRPCAPGTRRRRCPTLGPAGRAGHGTLVPISRSPGRPTAQTFVEGRLRDRRRWPIRSAASCSSHADRAPAQRLAPMSMSILTSPVSARRSSWWRLWTYVRDDRPAGSTDPPAVFFQYSPDRKAQWPLLHLQRFRGTLQADGYAGFERLYGERIQEAACWAHVRRKFYDIQVHQPSPIAEQALERIGRLYAIESEIRGRSAEERRSVRRTRAGPELAALRDWLHATLTTLSKKSELASAIRYALSRWPALLRYRDDGRLEIDNNAAERSIRPIALGRKNWLFAGSDDGGERAAAIYSLLGTAQLNGLNIEAYLKLLLDRLPDHPVNRVEELLPWAVAAELPALRLAA
ncbi:MAG: IS66 family transposase [Steroidobacteraceae bacterium]